MAKSRSLLVLGLCLLLSLPLVPPGLAAATPDDEVRWSRDSMPLEGEAGGWTLAYGSDVQHLAMAIDGTMYAYGGGLTYTLLKSTDDGYTWSSVGMVTASIVDIATAPNDAGVVYYATASNIYKSMDGGNSFVPLPPNPGGAGANNVAITSIDVVYLSHYVIAVGTRDADAAQYGGVYILDETEAFNSWVDTSAGSYDVYAVAFSPKLVADQQLVAVVSDETDTIVTTRTGSAGWGATVGNTKLDRDNSRIPTPVAVASADIAFPEDYDAGHYVLFVAIGTGGGNGDVYRINGRQTADLNIGFSYGLNNVDVTSLVVSGNAAGATLLAGAASSAQVYFSTDGGLSWTRSSKEPTGQTKTCVVMAADFSRSGKVYTATSGTESALSYTADRGVTWNQLSLIDTRITDILDLAPSPNYGQDDTIFMLTYGGKHSLWRSLDGGARWERVYSSALANVDSIRRVQLSPRYGNNSKALFIAGNSGGSPAIWHSADNGQSFSAPRLTRDPVTGATLSVDTWAVVDDSSLFIGSFNGSNGLVYRTTNGGWLFSTGVVAGSQSLYSIVLSPDYDQDGIILAGNTSGWVFWSSDRGISFERLPPDASLPPLSGNICVAFDPQFNSNRTVYAASSTADKGIYRFIINKSTQWERIDTSLPGVATMGQLRLSADGELYAVNSQSVVSATNKGGMERCLNPGYPLGLSFETVTRGLADGAMLSGLWLCEHRLWSIDTSSARLMTYYDSLSTPVSLTLPANGASGVGTQDVSLDWNALKGATRYQWQIDYDTDFSSPYEGFEDSTGVVTARLPTFKLATKYYWRVRVTEPVFSPWSAKWSFTTRLGSGVVAPELVSPEAGAGRVTLKPILQWSAIDGADRYELLVSTEVSFASPVIIKTGDYALPSTAWLCDITLDYNATYYWKVRAIGSGTSSAWSAVGAFTTEPPPEQTGLSPQEATPSPLPGPSLSLAPPLPAQVPSPAAPSQPIPDFVLYLIGFMCLIILVLIIALSVLVVRRR